MVFALGRETRNLSGNEKGAAKSCQALGSVSTEPAVTIMPAAASYGSLRHYQ